MQSDSTTVAALQALDLPLHPPPSQADITQAYRRAAARWHPDRCKEPNAAEKFHAARKAHETLMRRMGGAEAEAMDEEENERHNAEARSLLAEVFKGLIFSPRESGFIEGATRVLQHKITAINANRLQAEQDRSRLTAKRDRVRRRDGQEDNSVFRSIIDSELHRIEEMLPRIDTALHIHNRALAALSEYEGDAENMMAAFAADSMGMTRS